MNTAILGVGRMGRRHIQIARQLGFNVVGVFDVSPESLKAAQDEYELSDSVVFDDLSSLFDQAQPEALIIATTADSHCDLTCMAAERGVKYILVEKPMAVSLEQCDRMIETCRRHRAMLAVNHQMRFMEQYTEPKRLFATEAYGGMSSMTVIAGNFGFAMNGIHYFEAFRYLTEEMPEEVAAWFSSETVPNPRGSQFEDRAGSLRVVTAGGKRLYLEIGADQGHGVRVHYACRNGMITVDELMGEVLLSEREEQYRDLPTNRYGMPTINSSRSIEPAELIDTSSQVFEALINQENSVTGEDGRQAVEILAAAYQSAEQGGVAVGMEDALDRTRIFPWA